MARRNDHSPEQLTDLVIQHTSEFLRSQPASELSLRKLASGVGYSPGTLINLFGSYGYLLLAVNAHTLDQMQQKMDQAVVSVESDERQLQQMALAYLAFAESYPYRWRLVFEHRLAEDEPLPQWQTERIAQLFARVERMLTAINPHTSTEQQQLAARTLWASVHGICQMVLEGKLFAAADVTGSKMIDNLLSAYLNDWRQLGGDPG